MSYLKIDLIISKIEKDRLFQGDKHTHFYGIAFPKKNEPDTFLIKRALSKEEIESKKETEILGEIALVGSKPVEISREKAEQISKKIKEEAKHKDNLPF